MPSNRMPMVIDSMVKIQAGKEMLERYRVSKGNKKPLAVRQGF